MDIPSQQIEPADILTELETGKALVDRCDAIGRHRSGDGNAVEEYGSDAASGDAGGGVGIAIDATNPQPAALRIGVGIARTADESGALRQERGVGRRDRRPALVVPVGAWLGCSPPQYRPGCRVYSPAEAGFLPATPG